MELSEDEVQRALDRLQEEKLVWKVMGGRAVRWEHNLDSNLQLDRPSKAALILLFLRGPQTSGELRGRSDRLYSFESIAEVEETLRRLDPLAVELSRRPGQKEARWAQVLGEPSRPSRVAGSGVSPDEQSAAAPDAPQLRAGRQLSEEPLSARVQRLEEEVAALSAELHAFKAKLGE